MEKNSKIVSYAGKNIVFDKCKYRNTNNNKIDFYIVGNRVKNHKEIENKLILYRIHNIRKKTEKIFSSKKLNRNRLLKKMEFCKKYVDNKMYL